MVEVGILKLEKDDLEGHKSCLQTFEGLTYARGSRCLLCSSRLQNQTLFSLLGFQFQFRTMQRLPCEIVMKQLTLTELTKLQAL